MSGRPYRSLRVPEEVWDAARAEVGPDGNVTALLLGRLSTPVTVRPETLLELVEAVRAMDATLDAIYNLAGTGLLTAEAALAAVRAEIDVRMGEWAARPTSAPLRLVREEDKREA